MRNFAGGGRESATSYACRCGVIGKDADSPRLLPSRSLDGRHGKASVFIDTTGDGDLGARAGCEFEIGPREILPVSTHDDVRNARCEDVTQIADCMHLTGDDGRHVGPQAFRDTLARAGVSPSYGHACLFPIQGNLVLLMANHEYGINATNAAEVTDATLHARNEIHQIVRGLRNLEVLGMQCRSQPRRSKLEFVMGVGFEDVTR